MLTVSPGKVDRQGPLLVDTIIACLFSLGHVTLADDRTIFSFLSILCSTMNMPW